MDLSAMYEEFLKLIEPPGKSKEPEERLELCVPPGYGFDVNKENGKGHILDAGCGSGRDSKVFLDKGYRVTSIDGAEKMARFAAEHTGQYVHCMRFEDIPWEGCFDGVWACASLLHSSLAELFQPAETQRRGGGGGKSRRGHSFYSPAEPPLGQARDRLRRGGVFNKIIRALKPGGVMYMSFKHGAGEEYAEDGRFFMNFTEETLKENLEQQPGAAIIKIWRSESMVGDKMVQWVNGLVRRSG